jgi:SPX domain protein involved in polyphosphate accumulation
MEENMEDRQNKFRYERKYLLHKSKLNIFMKKLYLNNFEEIYTQRIINNIYYDTFNFSSFMETKEGVSDRIKYRVRWYGKVHEESEKVLELKIKSEFLNKKITYPLGVFKFRSPINENLKSLNKKIIKTLFKENSDFLNYNYNLQPVLRNNYIRKYFFSQNLGIRITIDSRLKFNSFLNGNCILDDKKSVIEIKYQKDNFFIMRDLFDLELKKKSKFETGIKLTQKI